MKIFFKSIFLLSIISVATNARSPIIPTRSVDCRQADDSSFVMKTDGYFYNYEMIVGDNPSTGYHWESNIDIDSTYIMDCKEPVPGCGGTRTFKIHQVDLESLESKWSKAVKIVLSLRTPGDNRKVSECSLVIKRN